MTRIPVERRRRGLPWYVWLLGALLLGGLLLLLLSSLMNNNSNRGTAGASGSPRASAVAGGNASGSAGAGASAGEASPGGAGASGAATDAAGASGSPAAGGSGGTGGDGDTITDLATISGADDAAGLEGRAAQLTDVTVQSVTGDVTFWVGESADDRVFVVLNEETQGETRVRVREGQRLRITGDVRSLPAAAQAQEEFGITAAQAEQLADEQVYIFADRVEIAD